ncbi:uncharacterized protein LOC126106759 [Schistocerca cancellata]|uniref:uncharacterized protein LOC126106759 n=1 Tax=Schistocerca cancellata TaxID=274614 RepID=UPI002117E90B|nr:uncharacterized protein LOC126106759 [Schistocerca cancellata]
MCCRVGKVCFCIDLRKGVATTAWVWLLGDAILLIVTSILTRQAWEAMIRNSWRNEIEREERDKKAIILAAWFWLAAVGIALSGLGVLLDFMLVKGATDVKSPLRKRRNLLQGWMAAYGVVYALGVVTAVLSVPVLFLLSPTPHHAFATAAGILLHAGLMVYFWLMVHSYSLELDQQRGECGVRPAAGNGYCTVPTGVSTPAQGTFCDAGGMTLTPTAPPRYTSVA